MSSNATGDVPPDTTAGTGTAAPTEVAEAAQVAQVAQLAEQAPEEVADAPATEPDGALAADRAPDTAAELTEGDDDPPAADAADVGEPGEPVAENEPGELAGEPIEMAEPVEFAEPVDEHEPGRRGRGALLTAGFVLAALAIVGGAIAIVGSLTHGYKKPVKVTYTKSAIFSLRTGECIDPHGQAASIVSCSTPHDAEVFATFALPGSKWPGNTSVQTAASSGCTDRLTAYINPQLAISLSQTYVYPDSVAWQAGTRTVICEVEATSGQLTGSVRGATATAS